MGNLFNFVGDMSKELFVIIERVEKLLYSEPSTALKEARLYSEYLVKLISKEEVLEEVYPLKHYERMRRLQRNHIIDESVYEKLEWIRKKGNKAVHEADGTDAIDAIHAHKVLYELSVWFMQVYVYLKHRVISYRKINKKLNGKNLNG